MRDIDIDLNTLFDILNEKYFNNELEKIEVNWNNRIYRSLGRYIRYFDNRKPIIEISSKYIEYKPEELENILVHEMIHHKYPDEKHGKYFIDEMNSLNNKFEELDIEIKSDNPLPGKYYYKCENANCNTVFNRNRKIDTSKYICSKCRSGLILINE